jgi:glycosyltransferase involved in cell wall biosynthesis
MTHQDRPFVLIFSPSPSGGLAEHTFYQARALEECGARVLCLVSPGFLGNRDLPSPCLRCLFDPPSGAPGLLRKLKLVFRMVANFWILAWNVICRRPSLVLLDSYVEYGAPFWVWPHWFMARVCAIQYAANLHDPVRNYQVGPAWWHRWSVRLGYLPLRFVLVHDVLPDPSPVPPGILTVQVPVGLYEFARENASADAPRQRWGVKPGQKVFLSFGYLRDNKNIDLVIRALVEVPDAFLVVAGSVASSHDKPFSYYMDLAASLGVSSRCHFSEGFVDDGQIGEMFLGADFVVLTYSASFHSQSGVLNIAARARRPVLASAGPGPLVECVRRYSLGVCVQPDSDSAIFEGMKLLVESPPVPCWEDYENAASWALNARRILEAAGIDEGCTGSTSSDTTESATH